MFEKRSIKEIIINNIEYYFSNGIKNGCNSCSSYFIPDINDTRIKKIIECYCINI